MRAKSSIAVLCILGLAVVAGIAWAQSVPQLINYQGRLLDDADLPLADGLTVDLTFAFYGVESGGTEYLTVLQENVQTSNGIYNVLIGSGAITPGTESSLSAVFQKHSDVWLGIKVNQDAEMAPRTLITSVPYAIRVDTRWLQTFMDTDDFDGDGDLKPGAGGGDCDDGDITISSLVAEVCDDGIDNDCDELIDGDDPDCQVTPYTSDPFTVILDHFDGSSSASINAYRYTGSNPPPACTPNSAWVSGVPGLSQALELSPPLGEPAGSATYLTYPQDWPLSTANGTIEFWVYLTTYGIPLVDQGPYYGSPSGWTFGMGVDPSGVLNAGAWAAFNMNSGSDTVPLDKWTHIAATWGSSGAKLYINGAEVGNDSNTSGPAAGYSAKLMLMIGSNIGSNRIDELRVSNTQRTAFNLQ